MADLPVLPLRGKRPSTFIRLVRGLMGEDMTISAKWVCHFGAPVIRAKVGIQFLVGMDPRFRGGDAGSGA
jgi:hypothetical protein